MYSHPSHIFRPLLNATRAFFGITAFTASPHWYPLAAVPVLALTLLAAMFMDDLSYQWGNFSTRRSKKEKKTENEKEAEKITGHNLLRMNIRKRVLEKQPEKPLKHKLSPRAVSKAIANARGIGASVGTSVAVFQDKAISI